MGYLKNHRSRKSNRWEGWQEWICFITHCRQEEYFHWKSKTYWWLNWAGTKWPAQESSCVPERGLRLHSVAHHHSYGLSHSTLAGHIYLQHLDVCLRCYRITGNSQSSLYWESRHTVLPALMSQIIMRRPEF